jgi:hypothetical protein
MLGVSGSVSQVVVKLKMRTSENIWCSYKIHINKLIICLQRFPFRIDNYLREGKKFPAFTKPKLSTYTVTYIRFKIRLDSLAQTQLLLMKREQKQLNSQAKLSFTWNQNIQKR